MAAVISSIRNDLRSKKMPNSYNANNQIITLKTIILACPVLIQWMFGYVTRLSRPEKAIQICE
jgi:hypothetical protein